MVIHCAADEYDVLIKDEKRKFMIGNLTKTLQTEKAGLFTE